MRIYAEVDFMIQVYTPTKNGGAAWTTVLRFWHTCMFPLALLAERAGDVDVGAGERCLEPGMSSKESEAKYLLLPISALLVMRSLYLGSRGGCCPDREKPLPPTDATSEGFTYLFQKCDALKFTAKLGDVSLFFRFPTEEFESKIKASYAKRLPGHRATLGVIFCEGLGYDQGDPKKDMLKASPALLKVRQCFVWNVSDTGSS